MKEKVGNREEILIEKEEEQTNKGLIQMIK